MKNKRRSINNYMANGGIVNQGLLKILPGVLDQLVSLANSSKSYDSQPTMTAKQIGNMPTPYSFAMGGSVEESFSPDELDSLQQQADELGISIEELIEQMQNEDFVNPEMKEDQYDTEDTEEYAMGGTVPIEVEDKEVIQPPNERAFQVKGKTHAEGGINIQVPPSTKVFSNRLKINGRTMQERKIKRDKTFEKLNRKLEKNPFNDLLKGTIERLSETNATEEANDMKIQDLATKIHKTANPEKYATGGTVPTSYSDYLSYNRDYNNPKGNSVLFGDFNNYNGNQALLDSEFDTPDTTVPAIRTLDRKFNPVISNTTSNIQVPKETDQGDSFTTGDYIGLAGTIFNGVAPLLNSRNAARNTQPVRNRFLGFGKRAIDANQTAQDLIAGEQEDALSDLQTSTNSAIERNRNNSGSIGILRALNTITEMNRNRAASQIKSNTSKQLMALLDREGALTSQQDYYQDQGAVVADNANQQNIDNIYSNKASDLVNFGNSIVGIGRSVNQVGENQDTMDLLGLLSENGIKIGRGKDGRLKIMNI